MEQELSDINDLLAELSQSNLENFLSRYPDYEDGLDIDTYSDRGHSSSTGSFNNNNATDLNSAEDQSRQTIVGDHFLESGPVYGDRRSYSDPMSASQSADRRTLTAAADVDTQLDALDLDGGGLASPVHTHKRSGSSNPVFSKQKYKQSITYL